MNAYTTKRTRQMMSIATATAAWRQQLAWTEQQLSSLLDPSLTTLLSKCENDGADGSAVGGALERPLPPGLAGSCADTLLKRVPKSTHFRKPLRIDLGQNLLQSQDR